MQATTVKPEQNNHSGSSPYKLFSKVGLNFSQDDGQPTEKNKEDQPTPLPLHGKRINAHNLFPVNAEDTIKEDGFYIR